MASFLKSKDSPKSLVRVTNSQKEVNKKKREESERKVLLKVGEVLTKRKKDMSTEFSSMEQKVAKVLQQEEDRVQAHAANQATRTAFGGDAKYMKWQDKVQEQNLISIKSRTKIILYGIQSTLLILALTLLTSVYACEIYYLFSSRIRKKWQKVITALL